MSTSTEDKKRYVLEYIRSLVAIEEAMEPYKEQKRELRTEYREQGWLNTDEIRAAVKAYRLFKGKVNIDDVYDNYKALSGENSEDEA
jgi:outer membrane translocation and assembly module TamA